MPRLAVDTWAFLEVYFRKRRDPDVQAVMDEAEGLFTCREVVAETFNAIARNARSTEDGWEWWEALRGSPIRVYEPPLDEVHAFMASRPRAGALSFVDWSLAYVATRERTRAVLTEDAEFRRLDLDPLFAGR